MAEVTGEDMAEVTGEAMAEVTGEDMAEVTAADIARAGVMAVGVMRPRPIEAESFIIVLPQTTAQPLAEPQHRARVLP